MEVEGERVQCEEAAPCSYGGPTYLLEWKLRSKAGATSAKPVLDQVPTSNVVLTLEVTLLLARLRET